MRFLQFSRFKLQQKKRPRLPAKRLNIFIMAKKPPPFFRMQTPFKKRFYNFIILHSSISLSSDQAAFAGLVDGKTTPFIPVSFKEYFT